MASTVYMDEPYITVTWDDDGKFIHTVWKAYANGEKYRTAMEKGLEILKEKRASRVLVDSRDLRVVDPEDQKWTTEDWSPRAVAAGLRYQAFLIPKSALAQSSLTRMTTKVGNINTEMAFFADLNEAKAWLRSQK